MEAESIQVAPERIFYDVLIVGDSDTSYLFSLNLQSIAYFTRVVHVIKARDAISILVQNQFAVVVLDNDAPDVDCFSLTNTIRKNLPLARIVIIAKDYSMELFKKLINEASVDAFIPIPIDDFSATSVIREQHAKYQINSMLTQLITEEPPKFSPSYYLLHDPSLFPRSSGKTEFLGVVINVSSITQFTLFYEELFQMDEYLIMGYISAISLLGQQLFEEKSPFQEINFGGISVIMQLVDEVQFLFFFKNLTKQNFPVLEQHIKDFKQKILEDHINDFHLTYPLSDEVITSINTKASLLKQLYLADVDYNQKQLLIIYGNQLPKLNSILATMPRFVEKKDQIVVKRFTDKDLLLDYLQMHQADILLINQVLKESDWTFTLAGQIKEVIPSIQVIAMVRRYNQSEIIRILNDDNIDYILSYVDSEDHFEKYILEALERSIQIKEKITFHQPHDVKYSHQSTVTRSLLRSNQDSFEISHVPELFGMFISHEDEPFYSNFWPISERPINFDQHLFAGFINSIELFTTEIFETEGEFNGLKFGDIQLVMKKLFDYSFVYFVGNVDHTNYVLIDKATKDISQEMYELIYNEDLFGNRKQSRLELERLLYQSMVELHVRFTSLNF